MLGHGGVVGHDAVEFVGTVVDIPVGRYVATAVDVGDNEDDIAEDLREEAFLELDFFFDLEHDG